MFLEPYTILEIGEYVAAPYAGKMFSDVGAEVLKVEPPGGDVSRSIPPFLDGDGDVEPSAFFAYLNTGKKSITVDPQAERYDDDLLAIIDEYEVDLVIETSLDAFSLNPDELISNVDGLSVISITAYGSTGPRRNDEAPEIIAMAESGHMNKMGYPDKPPTRPQIKSADYWAGQHAALSGLGILLSRELHGENSGHHIDVSKREAAITYMEGFITGYSYSGETTERKGYGYPDQDGQPGLPAIYETSDGYISAAVTGSWWDRVCEDILNQPDLTDDERFTTPERRLENLEQIRTVVEEHTSTREKWELFREMQDSGIPCGVTATAEELVEFEHLNERDFWQDVPIDGKQTMTMPGFPYRIDYSPIEMERPPRLGEHTFEMYERLDRTPTTSPTNRVN